jgi:hypothetical protein
MTTNGIKKRTTLDLSIATGYVPNWGVWEGLRELVQNAADADDLGYPATYRHVQTAQGGALRIINDGVVLKRESILLGATTKDGREDQRGKFGEGFKLAWLALCRKGIKVRFRTGDEQWTPRIEQSDVYGTEVLKVDISPIQYRNQTQVDVFGVDDEAWDMVRGKCLFLSKPKDKDVIVVDKDQILRSPDHAGLLFVRGIFVSKLPGKYFYGYDLADCGIDRDRRIADPWDLKYSIARTLSSAVGRQLLAAEDMWQLLQADWEEASAVADVTYRTQELTDAMAKYFKGQHGEDAIPVVDTAQTIDAAHHGLRAVAVGAKAAVVLERVTGKLEDRKAKRAMDIERTYSAADLSPAEIENFTWVTMLTDVAGIKASISVVDFVGPTIEGLFSSKDGFVKISLAKRIVLDRKQLLAALVHELAHVAGDDGSVQHRDAIDNIYCAIVLALDR